jgi:hypothetical protein
LKRKMSAPINRKRRAAPPIDAPAIPPGLSAAEDAAAVVEDCAGGAEELDAGEDVDDGGEVETAPDPEGVGVGTPDGPRSEYGAQSGLGKARGQLGS